MADCFAVWIRRARCQLPQTSTSRALEATTAWGQHLLIHRRGCNRCVPLRARMLTLPARDPFPISERGSTEPLRDSSIVAM
jgi:hypothetical protein